MITCCDFEAAAISELPLLFLDNYNHWRRFKNEKTLDLYYWIIKKLKKIGKFLIHTIRNIIWIHSLKNKKVIEILLDRRKICEHGR